ncbi:hypothetical protein [Acinetobacter gerneri]|uniref:Uncharacterized protein n=1 Tax=Acinetobacter gerneri DSM 14967 = CIP 107464 = MTCC 9824 TaxID=1120926 RepID=N8YB82_9GAMM|nr:hypothetical protein [Acinetobacter gerneri]ENV33916.1 hypothetical protein F960_01922 [Acinetobacter gerneri DSM 14967 = CIP 107464 = MTCC 9824]EPR82793.1 hypothetical protein L289_2711 [Acinetobacter gerneri DSM 14967 = CIP 107464 = MTCC 9824]
MAIGIPYVEALNMPLHIAIAFLNDERQTLQRIEKNIEEQTAPAKSSIPQQPQRSNTETKTYISTVRLHGKK